MFTYSGVIVWVEKQAAVVPIALAGSRNHAGLVYLMHKHSLLPYGYLFIPNKPRKLRHTDLTDFDSPTWRKLSGHCVCGFCYDLSMNISTNQMRISFSIMPRGCSIIWTVEAAVNGETGISNFSVCLSDSDSNCDFFRGGHFYLKCDKWTRAVKR